MINKNYFKHKQVVEQKKREQRASCCKIFTLERGVPVFVYTDFFMILFTYTLMSVNMFADVGAITLGM